MGAGDAFNGVLHLLNTRNGKMALYHDILYWLTSRCRRVPVSFLRNC